MRVGGGSGKVSHKIVIPVTPRLKLYAEQMTICIRVWSAVPDARQVSGMHYVIRDTILFDEDMVRCSNTNGYEMVDLKHPDSLQYLLDWMKKSGLVPEQTQLEPPNDQRNCYSLVE